MSRTRLALALILALILVVIVTIPVHGEDGGVIVIIIEMAQGWSKIAKVGTINTTDINRIFNHPLTDISKIGGISTN